MKKLIIAEKPSVAKNIADATGSTRKDGYFEGDQYVISWAFGHLLQLYDARDYNPEMKSWKMEYFPYIPEHFCYKVKSAAGKKDQPDPGAARQIRILKQLMERQDVEGIISATDDDREGQIIADEIFLYLKPSKPVQRILLNEWTAEEVHRGLQSLVDNLSMKPLQDAGFGRQLADWLIGINLTSVATLKYRRQKKICLLNIGRVLMPTLKIIYDRDQEIENFKVTKYCKLKADFLTQTRENFSGIYYLDKNEKFDQKEELAALAGKLPGHLAKIIRMDVNKKKEYPPYLFNLTGLQGYITGRYKGWTSDQVLKTAQALYEKKLITYPRTASVVLDESLEDRVKKVLEVHRQQSPYRDQIAFKKTRRIFDSKKVEGHSAIIPTYVLPGTLTDREHMVYEAVRNRFLAQFMPLALSEDTVADLKVQDMELPGVFTARGKIQLEFGWKQIEGVDVREVLLPPLEEGQLVTVTEATVEEVERKPPKPHTEKTLLRVMETCGKKYEKEESEERMLAVLSGFSIGTPATRAETIKKLKSAGYITARGKSLRCTELGKMLVETFPVRDLFDLEYTGKLEKTLSDIEKQKYNKEDFLNQIREFVKESVEKIKKDENFGGWEAVSLHKEPAGLCPECGKPVTESERAFGCSGWREGCGFVIWKNDRLIRSLGKKVSYEMVKILLEHGKVGFRGCVSKKGNRFDAYFYYEKNQETGRYDWRLEFLG